MTDDVVKQCRAGDRIDLDDHDPGEKFGWQKEEAQAAFVEEMAVVSELQRKFFAAEDAALLVVLQAMDAGGKDGTIRSVLNGVNPAGVDVNSFGVPSDEERAHDYLWRVHAHTPAKGQIGIFNRSHYEDVLVVRVKGFVPESVWSKRYGHIRQFEQMLVDEGTHLVKIFLNVSKEEQRERLQDRVDDPDERWKFRLGDLDDRNLWDDYQLAFRDAIRKTTTDDAPWYVVPADRKWVRNLVVAKILRHHLERIDPHYPPAEEGIEGLIVE
ncbi:MAG: polyphosphate kinase 2 family protein [Acidimicrobiia bacterium]|nr:polyphosphate kinase 2 family protein [Acidimicrobiia bacterium]